METDDNLDELSDEELLKQAREELRFFTALAEHEPAITREMLRKLEDSCLSLEKSIEASKKADLELKIAAVCLKDAAMNLLSHPDLPDGKPIGFAPLKKKGN